MLDIKFKDSVESKYREVGDFHEGYAKVMNYEYLYGFINKLGKEVIPCQFIKADDFHEGMSCVSNDSYIGYIDVLGNVVIPYKYNEATSFSEGLAAVCQRDKWNKYSEWYIIDKLGEVKVALDFHEYKIRNVGNFKNGITKIVLNDANNKEHVYYMNNHGKYVASSMIGTDFSDGYAYIKDRYIYGVVYKIDTNGNTVSAILGTNDIRKLYNSSSGMTRFDYINGKSGFIDENDQVVLTDYNFKRDFHEGVAVVSYPRYHVSFMDKNGNMTSFVNDKYTDISDFSEGLAVCKNKDSNHGYINLLGTEVIPCIYKAASDFHEGMSVVKDNNKHTHYINEFGDKIISIPDIYKSVVYIEGEKYATLAAYSERELYGKKREFLLNLQKGVAKVFDDVCEEEAKTLKKC